MPGSWLSLLQVQQSRAACPISPLHPAVPGQLWAGSAQQELTCLFGALAVNHGGFVLRGCRTLVLRGSTAAFNVIDGQVEGAGGSRQNRSDTRTL